MGKTIHDQRYISDELCHFVGKGKEEYEQYDILVNKILKTGWLTYGPHHNPKVPRGVGLDLSKPISTDEAIKYEVICFCDIPVPDLIIHVNKYSKFGLSFKKSFLVDKGACPVFYISNDSHVPIIGLWPPGDFVERCNQAQAKGFFDRALYFDVLFRNVTDILVALNVLSCEENERYIKKVNVSDFRARIGLLFGLTESQISAMETTLKGSKQAAQTIKILTDFLLNYVFTYFKCFDSKRDVDDELNYYMEREWRVGGNVNFALTDVSRVFFPQKFASKFRKDLPEYLGQITFLD